MVTIPKCYFFVIHITQTRILILEIFNFFYKCKILQPQIIPKLLRIWWPPMHRNHKFHSIYLEAESVLIGRPWSSNPCMRWMAFCAVWGSVISTKPKPFGLPVSRSQTIFTRLTCPNWAKASPSSCSVTAQAKFPTKMELDMLKIESGERELDDKQKTKRHKKPL